MSKKILLSGVQPSGRPHIGNYFGAMKQFVDLQDDYKAYIFIADYHALHSLQNPKEMKENIINILLDYLAIGLDPKKVTIFKQSDISEHTELAWIFDTITTMPKLMEAHAFKARVSKIGADDFLKKMNESNVEEEKGWETYKDFINRVFKDIDVGTFNYPVLMAADILMYDADVVPVGADQKQHVEIARDIAKKFNHIFGQTFKLPKEKIVEDVFTEKGSMIGIDGRKMSKSYKNTIPLFASDEEIKKITMSIVTDSGEDGAINVRHIHYPIRKLLYPNELTGDYFDKLYSENKRNYKALKEALITDLISFIAPLRERRKELEKDIPKVLKILKAGGEEAKKIATKKMTEVREKIGVNL